MTQIEFGQRLNHKEKEPFQITYNVSQFVKPPDIEINQLLL